MENDDDTLIVQKQELLKKEIIDKNYDKEKFLEYCIKKKENGDDLHNWTFQELHEACADFAGQESKTLTSEKRKKQDPNGQMKEEINKDVEKITIYNTTSDEKYFNKEIICRKLDKSVLNDINLSITIQNPKSVEAGIFSSNYTVYDVFTLPLEWTVKRRYSDFQWLRHTLAKLFPGFMIPPMPNKKIGSRRFEYDFVQKRMNFLQKFLNTVLENEYFKSSEAFVAFLSFTDRVMFENKMKEFNAIHSSYYVEDIKTFEGKVGIVDDEENEKYFSNTTNFFKYQTQLLERLNYNLKNFYINIQSACINLEDIQKDFETMAMLNGKVLMKDQVTNSYEELGIFFKNWKRILFNQNDVIKTSIKDFFKFVKMETLSYSELIKSREEYKTKYNLELLRLNVKKEKQWNQMDISKWELSEEGEPVERSLLTKDKTYAFKKMCHKETTHLNNLHKKLGYINRMNINELQRLINSHCTRYIGNMKQFVEKFYPSLTDGINVWSHMATFVSGY